MKTHESLSLTGLALAFILVILAVAYTAGTHWGIILLAAVFTTVAFLANNEIADEVIEKISAFFKKLKECVCEPSQVSGYEGEDWSPIPNEEVENESSEAISDIIGLAEEPLKKIILLVAILITAVTVFVLFFY